MTAAELLKAARAKIERPECWTKGEFARDACGELVSSAARDAACWCASGALLSFPLEYREYNTAHRLLESACDDDIVNWNDAPERTHAEVLAAFDRAIELAESEGA